VLLTIVFYNVIDTTMMFDNYELCRIYDDIMKTDTSTLSRT